MINYWIGETIFLLQFNNSEHFCDPVDKLHPKFASCADTEMTLYSACDQMSGQPAKLVSIGDAVKQGKTIQNVFI